MNAPDLEALLVRHGACREARDWLAVRDAEAAWNECPRGDWLLWLAGRVRIERAVLVRAAARCAETALIYVPEGEDRPRQCIEAILRWCDDPNDENRAALRRARQAATSAAAAYAADAAYAYAAACAAACAAYAAAEAAYAAYASTGRRNARARCADIVREHISLAAFLTAAEAVS